MGRILDDIYARALGLEALSRDQGLRLWHQSPLDELMAVAHAVRQLQVPGNGVTWQIDRNINLSNECASACLFCNFHAGAGKIPAFTTPRDEYVAKIEELRLLGGDQILLQGGLSPRWRLKDYEMLLSWLRERFPWLRIHALGPPEVHYIAQCEGLSVRHTLERLMAAGLSSLPGAGAEILVDRVRQLISPRKCTATQWETVMREAQALGLLTSATMMYGHLETVEERFDHLLRIRSLQTSRPEGSAGFLAFIPWPFQDAGTRLRAQYGPRHVPMEEHLRMVAISRLMLHNIPHIQASWLTVGVGTAQLSLWGGADDMGSIMIEERVVASAGGHFRLDAVGMCRAIREAGFLPILRDQAYRPRPWPPVPVKIEGKE